MPGMDGVEATKRIRALGAPGAPGGEEPYYKNLPIIALTANAISGMEEMFLSNGFDDFLSKPIDTVMLNTVLAKWLPKEKQTRSVAEGGRAPVIRKPSLSGIAIDGLDAKKGIRLSGGTHEYFFETLSAFYEDGLGRMNEIRKCLDSGNLPLYITIVHGLKSASANIGADMLSEAAYALEMAGLKGDLAYIETNSDHFLMMLKRLLNNIGSAISLHDCGSGKTGEFFEAGQFKNELVKLKQALADMNAGVINKTVDNLLKSAGTEDTKNAVRKLSKHIMMVEYDEADALVDFLLEKVNS